MHRRFTIALLGMAILLLAACSDRGLTTSSVDAPLVRPQSARLGPEFWSGMSDEVMGTWLDSSSNKVFIGLKRPGQGRGVSPRGERLIDVITERAFHAQLRILGVRIDRVHDLPMILAEVPRNMLRRIRELPFVDYIEPVVQFQMEAQDTTADLRHINTHIAWSFSGSSGSGRKILILDSGRDPTHEDLAGMEGYTCAGGSANDGTGHGTGIAGIIGARNNQVGVIGGAYSANVVSMRVGGTSFPTENVVCAIQWGRDNDVHIFNLSLSNPVYQSAMADQINAAWGEGGLIVASAGNEPGPVLFPASMDNVIAVAGTNLQDQSYGGASGDKVEISANAVAVRTTVPTWATHCVPDTSAPGYGWCQGISFAVPQVAYAAAIVWSNTPTLTNAQVRARLQASAVELGAPGRDPIFGFGRLNVLGAVSNVGGTPFTGLTVNGPTCVYSTAPHSYDAAVTGGTAPYQYQWYRSYAASGYQTWSSDGPGQFKDLSFSAGSYSAQVKVRATDALGLIYETIKWVQVHTGANLESGMASSSDSRPDAKLCGGGGGGGGEIP